MADVIRDQVAFHFPLAASASIEMVVDIPETLPLVLANRRNMEEVLSNLITNAIKYSTGGGRIMIAAAIVNDYLRIQVKDTGMGISAEDQHRIFQRFYRVKDETTRHITGTGLGLAIVKSILESHQGRIKIESQQGEGSTFSVFLPILTS